MADRTVTAIPIAGQAPAARLEPDAIGAAQDTIIGMGNSAPTVALGLVLAYLAASSAYGSGPVIVLCGIPMLIIANAYRRLNLWSANCGASFEWVGRAINPYLGFMTGWLMIAASLIAAVSGVVVLGPSVLAIAGAAAVKHLAQHHHQHGRHRGPAGDRRRRHPPDRAQPGRDGADRVRDPDRLLGVGVSWRCSVTTMARSR